MKLLLKPIPFQAAKAHISSLGLCFVRSKIKNNWVTFDLLTKLALFISNEKQNCQHYIKVVT